MKARILISFNNALMAAWMKEPLCCKSQEEENSYKRVEQEFSIQPVVRLILGARSKRWKYGLLKKQRSSVECALSCWNVHLSAAGIGLDKRERERENALSLLRLVCPAASKLGREEVEGVIHSLLCCLGRWPGQNGISHSHWTKYMNLKLQQPKQFLH